MRRRVVADYVFEGLDGLGGRRCASAGSRARCGGGLAGFEVRPFLFRRRPIPTVYDERGRGGCKSWRWRDHAEER